MLQFPGLQLKHEGSISPVSDRYYEALSMLMASLKETAAEYGLPVKEVTIDLLYLSVGDEIVTQMIDRAEE